MKKFDKDDVIWGYTGSSSGKTGKLSRKSKITSRTVFVEHKLSGIKVEESIPIGHYSKKEMTKLTEKLFVKLEQLVNGK